MQLRQLIGADDALDPRYLENLNAGKRPEDGLPPQAQQFRDQGHMASPSGRMTPDMTQPRRGDSSGHPLGDPALMGSLWNPDGMQGLPYSATPQPGQPQLMRGQGGLPMSRSNGSMAQQDRGGMMRDNMGASNMF